MATRSKRHEPGHAGETAAHYLIAGVPRFPVDARAAHVRGVLGSGRYQSVDVVCALDDQDRLVGVAPIGAVLQLADDRPLADAIVRDWPRVHPEVDQERIASTALHHGVDTIAVVDRGGRLLGVVPGHALIVILRREHVEDLHRLAGIARETHRAREAMEVPPLRRARDRLPWLLIGLVGCAFATFVVSRFEATLQANLAIAFFVPGLVYLAAAIGTQSEAIAVRGLSLSHARIGRLLGAELRTGLLIGLTLGAITFPAVWLAFGELWLATAVASALVCAGGVASTIGLLLPWLLSRFGSDPAYGSGPLATIIQDVLTLVIYFATVSVTLA